MTDPGIALYDADDGRLLSLVGAGDADAFRVLSGRHEWAARKLARRLVSSAEEEDVVAEAFRRIFAFIRRGGGPSNAFRPYVLTAVRRVSEGQRGQPTPLSRDEPQLTDPGTPLVDPAVAGVEQTLAARAYLSLPERWRAVLWHTEIEQEHSLVVTPLLGLTRSGIAALNRQAIDGLRQAFVELYVQALARPECESTAGRLDAYVRDALPAPEATAVWEHVRSCDQCQAAYRELSGIRATLRGTVAPLILGSAVDAYLVGTEALAASEGTAGKDTLALHRADGDFLGKGASASHRTRGSRHSRRRLSPGIAVAAGVAIVVLVAGAVAFALNSAPRGSPGTGSAMASPAGSGVTGQPGHAAPAPSSPVPSPTPVSAPAVTSPPPPATVAQTLVSLSASMDISPAQFSSTSSASTDEVGFDVANTGTVATGPLTVAITLPPGSAPADTSPSGQPTSTNSGFTGGRPEGSGSAMGGLGGFGWSCEPTDSGITCMHDPVAAGQHVDGRLSVTVSGFMTCGKEVTLTASSGSATAQAVEDLRC